MLLDKKDKRLKVDMSLCINYCLPRFSCALLW